MKLWWHKVRHWEYWSVYVVYTPTFFVWMWFALQFRDLYFFRLANPSIKNGGFSGESKYAIYQLLPKGVYPKTVLVNPQADNDFLEIVEANGFKFPLYAKPDVGERGVGVQKVWDIAGLLAYAQNTQADFLIQEAIEYPNELGLFYCRLPKEGNGKITGITLKKFLTVEGDGRSSVEHILRKNPRYEMQIPKLRTKMDLSEILRQGEKRCLVPYGNHNLGTEFLDGKAFISEKLVETFDELLKNVEGFYYGRLDIRYNTLEELEEGVNFSVIELNGVKSEPTHIYDFRHSFWFGQREIFRHQKILKQIAEQNYTKS